MSIEYIIDNDRIVARQSLMPFVESFATEVSPSEECDDSGNPTSDTDNINKVDNTELFVFMN